MRKIDNTPKTYPVDAHLGMNTFLFDKHPLKEAAARQWLDMLTERWDGNPNSGLDEILNITTTEKDAMLIATVVTWLVGTTVWSEHLKKMAENIWGEFTPPAPPPAIDYESVDIWSILEWMRLFAVNSDKSEEL